MEPGVAIFKNKVSIEDARKLLADLVSISSINPYDIKDYSWPPYGESKASEYVANYLQNIGCIVNYQEVLPKRANVIATLPGRDNEKTVMLETHLDTVQVDNMTIEPFSATVDNNRLYGRGACDAKGSLAAMILAIKLLHDNAYDMPSIILAAVVDEEYKYRGVLKLIESGLIADACIVGEPTNLDIVVAHKGSMRCRIITNGKAAHSSCPEKGINAIDKMANVIIGIREELNIKHEGKKHPLVGNPTLSIGLISGGMGVNTVPDRCIIDIDRRIIPGETADEAFREINNALDALRSADPQLEVYTEEPYLVDIPLEAPLDSILVKSAKRASEVILGTSRIVGVPYGTDASKIAARGMPCVVFGPGSIHEAHSAVEYVELSQVVKAAEIIAQTMLYIGKM